MAGLYRHANGLIGGGVKNAKATLGYHTHDHHTPGIAPGHEGLIPAPVLEKQQLQPGIHIGQLCPTTTVSCPRPALYFGASMQDVAFPEHIKMSGAGCWHPLEQPQLCHVNSMVKPFFGGCPLDLFTPGLAIGTYEDRTGFFQGVVVKSPVSRKLDLFEEFIVPSLLGHDLAKKNASTISAVKDALTGDSTAPHLNTTTSLVFVNASVAGQDTGRYGEKVLVFLQSSDTEDAKYITAMYGLPGLKVADQLFQALAPTAEGRLWTPSSLTNAQERARDVAATVARGTGMDGRGNPATIFFGPDPIMPLGRPAKVPRAAKAVSAAEARAGVYCDFMQPCFLGG